MALLTFNRTPSPRLIRQFGLIVLPAFLGILGFLAWWRTGTLQTAALLWSLGAVAIPLTLWQPRVIRALWVTWMIITYPIGWVISNLALLVAYGVAVAPLGIALRVLGKDPLNRRRNPSVPSYWIAHDPAQDRSRYFRQY